ncbi:hypothetical protein [Labrys neptuniae]
MGDHPYAKMAVAVSLAGILGMLIGSYSGIAAGRASERASWEALSDKELTRILCRMVETNKLPRQE